MKLLALAFSVVAAAAVFPQQSAPTVTGTWMARLGERWDGRDGERRGLSKYR